jgi:hypothetical protein
MHATRTKLPIGFVSLLPSHHTTTPFVTPVSLALQAVDTTFTSLPATPPFEPVALAQGAANTMSTALHQSIALQRPSIPLRQRHPDYTKTPNPQDDASDSDVYSDGDGETTAVDELQDNYVRKVLAKTKPLPPMYVSVCPEEVQRTDDAPVAAPGSRCTARSMSSRPSHLPSSPPSPSTGPCTTSSSGRRPLGQ